MPLSITPLAELKLAHLAYFLEATPHAKTIAAASHKGDVSVLNENLMTLYSYNIGFPIANLTISPDGQILAATSKNGQLIVFQIDGKVIFEEKIGKNESEVDYGCLFSIDGTKLWGIAENTEGQILIQYRETESWQVLKQALLPNVDLYSYLSLISHPKSEIICVCEAAGQDGAWIYWVWDDAEIRVQEIAELEEAAPPEFHPEGKEFLAYYYNTGHLFRYSFPDCYWMGAATLDIGEDDFISFHQCYLSNDRAIVKSENGRLFIITLDNMDIIDEIILQGYEPCREKDYIYTDLSVFKSVGENRILSKHRHDYRENRNTLLLWEVL